MLFLKKEKMTEKGREGLGRVRKGKGRKEKGKGREENEHFSLALKVWKEIF